LWQHFFGVELRDSAVATAGIFDKTGRTIEIVRQQLTANLSIGMAGELSF